MVWGNHARRRSRKQRDYEGGGVLIDNHINHCEHVKRCTEAGIAIPVVVAYDESIHSHCKKCRGHHTSLSSSFCLQCMRSKVFLLLSVTFDNGMILQTILGCLMLMVVVQTAIHLQYSQQRTLFKLFHKKPFSSLMVMPPVQRSVALPTGRLFDDTTRPAPFYGDLQFQSLRGASPQHFQRTIRQEPQAHPEQQQESEPQWMALDQTHEQGNGDCQRSSWQFLTFPNCNTFHEIQPDPMEKKFLGSGYYRIAWLVQQQQQLANNNSSHNKSNKSKGDDTFVLKQQLLNNDPNDWERQVNTETLLMNQREAIIMERLTSSPRIVNAFGLCGTSMLVEAMQENIVKSIIPGTGLGQAGLAEETTYERFSSVPLVSQLMIGHKLPTLEQKLDLAITMSEAVADMHGFVGGVIVNSDVSLSQFLYDGDGNIRLNDFNIASILDWNPKTHEYCKMNRPKWNGRIYAPEQYRGDPIDEKVDVMSMAHIIYSLLTGMWPFYDIANQDDVGSRVLKNLERPYVSDRYRHGSYIERRLVEIMERMWAENPAERPEIFEVVQFLKEIKRVSTSNHSYIRGER